MLYKIYGISGDADSVEESLLSVAVGNGKSLLSDMKSPNSSNGNLVPGESLTGMGLFNKTIS